MSTARTSAKATPGRDPIAGEWAGIPQYRCPFCAFDALDAAATVAHIAEKHPLPPPPITKPDTATTPHETRE